MSRQSHTGSTTEDVKEEAVVPTVTKAKDKVIKYMQDIENLENFSAEQKQAFYAFLVEKLGSYEKTKTQPIVETLRKAVTENLEGDHLNAAFFKAAQSLLTNFNRFKNLEKIVSRIYLCYFYCATGFNNPQAWEQIALLHSNVNYSPPLDNLTKYIYRHIATLPSLSNYYHKTLINMSITVIYLYHRAFHEYCCDNQFDAMLRTATEINRLFQATDRQLVAKFSLDTLIDMSQKLIETYLTSAQPFHNMVDVVKIIVNSNSTLLKLTHALARNLGHTRHEDIQTHLLSIIGSYQDLLANLKSQRGDYRQLICEGILPQVKAVAAEFDSRGYFIEAFETQKLYVQTCLQYSTPVHDGYQLYFDYVNHTVIEQERHVEERNARAKKGPDLFDFLKEGIEALNFVVNQEHDFTSCKRALELQKKCLNLQLPLSSTSRISVRQNIEAHLKENDEKIERATHKENYQQIFEDVKSQTEELDAVDMTKIYAQQLFQVQWRTLNRLTGSSIAEAKAGYSGDTRPVADKCLLLVHQQRLNVVVKIIKLLTARKLHLQEKGSTSKLSYIEGRLNSLNGNQRALEMVLKQISARLQDTSSPQRVKSNGIRTTATEQQGLVEEKTFTAPSTPPVERAPLPPTTSNLSASAVPLVRQPKQDASPPLLSSTITIPAIPESKEVRDTPVIPVAPAPPPLPSPIKHAPATPQPPINGSSASQKIPPAPEVPLLPPTVGAASAVPSGEQVIPVIPNAPPPPPPLPSPKTRAPTAPQTNGSSAKATVTPAPKAPLTLQRQPSTNSGLAAHLNAITLFSRDNLKKALPREEAESKNGGRNELLSAIKGRGKTALRPVERQPRKPPPKTGLALALEKRMKQMRDVVASSDDEKVEKNSGGEWGSSSDSEGSTSPTT